MVTCVPMKNGPSRRPIPQPISGFDTAFVLMADKTMILSDETPVLRDCGMAIAEVASERLAVLATNVLIKQKSATIRTLRVVRMEQLTPIEVIHARQQIRRTESIERNLDSDEYSPTDPTAKALANYCRLFEAALDEARPLASLTTLNTQSPHSLWGAALRELINAIEEHRLQFIYWAVAFRTGSSSRTKASAFGETVEKDAVLGWREMQEDIDSEGRFLRIHQGVLERYAEEAVSRFGFGQKAKSKNASIGSKSLNEEHPAWRLNDGATHYLKRSSERVCNRCAEMVRLRTDSSVKGIADEVSELAWNPSNPGWYTNIAVPWEYLFSLDRIIVKVRRFELEAISIDDSSVQAQLGSDERPTGQQCADLAMYFLIGRDVRRIARDYPSKLTSQVRDEWMERIRSAIQQELQNPSFRLLKSDIENHPSALSNDSDSWGIYMSAVILQHPDLKPDDSTEASINKAMTSIVEKCQREASPAVQAHISRLMGIMTVSCLHPEKSGDASLRSLQLLQMYWAQAEAIVNVQLRFDLEYSPHPLLHLIENLRSRIKLCFLSLKECDDNSKASNACDTLLGLLSEGPVQDLSAVDEWTREQLTLVQMFIARARLRLGPGQFPLTTAEEYVLRQWEKDIERFVENAKAAHKRVFAPSKAAVQNQDSNVQSKAQDYSNVWLPRTWFIDVTTHYDCSKGALTRKLCLAWEDKSPKLRVKTLEGTNSRKAYLLSEVLSHPKFSAWKLLFEQAFQSKYAGAGEGWTKKNNLDRMKKKPN